MNILKIIFAIPILFMLTVLGIALFISSIITVVIWLLFAEIGKCLPTIY